MTRWHQGDLSELTGAPDSLATLPYEPTVDAALARIAAFDPARYARTRNALTGHVSTLSPYITHGLITLHDVLQRVNARHPLPVQHKFVYELGWRAYFRHVWQRRGAGILQNLHAGPLPSHAYQREVPADVREARSGLAVIDCAVRELYTVGTLHNHARMWLASYLVHLRKVHWRAGADWLYSHLLDGDMASNHLSWQWVAGTGSHKPYLFNAKNVARYAPATWHCPGSVLDNSYAALEAIAFSEQEFPPAPGTHAEGVAEPVLLPAPPDFCGASTPDSAHVAGCDVWLVHPWCLGGVPANLPTNTRVIGVYLADFHHDWPWTVRRWQFVSTAMKTIDPICWHGDAVSVATALKAARSVRSYAEPHLAPWLGHFATCEAPASLFPAVQGPCASFSQWWRAATAGFTTASELIARQGGRPDNPASQEANA